MPAESDREAPVSCGYRASMWLKAIVVFYVGRGLLLVVVGLGLFHHLDENLGTTAARWIENLDLDSQHRYARALIDRVGWLNVGDRQNLSIATVLYGALLLTEGVGLWYRQRWAAYLAAITVALLIPFELYELIRTPTAATVVILLLNVAIAWYLMVTVIREGHKRPRG
jgi:uncharacterized membrane protein (DUF2068 family)